MASPDGPRRGQGMGGVQGDQVRLPQVHSGHPAIVRASQARRGAVSDRESIAPTMARQFQDQEDQAPREGEARDRNGEG